MAQHLLQLIAATRQVAVAWLAVAALLAPGVLRGQEQPALPPPSDLAVGPEAVEERLAEDLGERLAQWWATVANVWDHVVYEAEGSKITVGKVVLALLLLTLGLWASRRLSRLFARRVLGRFRLAEGAIAAFQTLTFYFLVVAFFLWALNVVQIPLTLFTFLGGAVAIGVGFGSQNIVNNFMSGLILMVERPVRVGDLIDLEGASGRVEQIGLRSTRIRSGDNTHVIVPNSHLLENRVLNRTLSDNVMRTDVQVGVAYGSDLGKVRRCLEQAIEASESVLESPPPEILFTDFGDNALVFRALFWTKVRTPLDSARAQSEVRFHADALFREAGVAVAFPQRDVHLDALGPLEVRLRRGAVESE
ncbi:MAG TPA: mechanosensitive ion channel domain-containing protein [Thermoanaerobaculia bacterium]